MLNENHPLIKDWLNKLKSHTITKSITKRLTRGNQTKWLVEASSKQHAIVFGKLDCLECANCCSTIPPIVNKPDRKRIAKYLGLSVKAFEQDYISLDEDGDSVMKTVPCVFLGKDNTCSIYEVRPKACRQFPHTDGYDFIEQLSIHEQNVKHCPASLRIITNMLELQKK